MSAIKIISAFFICTVSLVGCEKLSNFVEPRPTDSKPIEFELRDFSVSKKDSSEYGSTFIGRGSIVTQNPELKGKKTIVSLKVKIKNLADRSENAERGTSIIVSDGVGLVETSEYTINGVSVIDFLTSSIPTERSPLKEINTANAILTVPG